VQDIAPGMARCSHAERFVQPLAGIGAEHGKSSGEVDLVLRPPPEGLVEELHLRRQNQYPVVSTKAKRRDRTSQPNIAPRPPLISVRFIQHELKTPRAAQSFTTPNVVHFRRQPLALVSRTQGSWWIGRLDVPSFQDLVHPLLIPAQEEYIDVAMRSDCVPQEQLNRPPASDPPWCRQRAKQRRDLCRRHWVPRAQLVGHVRSVPELSARRTTPSFANETARRR
jgi:hypothetical protein